jgi:hypothetical protein
VQIYQDVYFYGQRQAGLYQAGSSRRMDAGINKVLALIDVGLPAFGIFECRFQSVAARPL